MPQLTRRTTAGSALLAIGFILAACGAGAPSTTQSAASTSAAASAFTEGSAAEAAGLCARVPIDQVDLALGMQTDGGVDDESFLTGGLTCRFTGDAEHILDVELSEQTHDDWLEAIETVGLNDEPVEGVGDEAYRAAGTALGGPGARFTAWSEGFDVGVTIYSDVDQAVSFAAAQAIAEALLESAAE
ncbi:MAG TPA: hypothetical protein VFH90_08990 [Candidatus Limnocylindria bacterium]|nr:hypothetical protein [Candidatus Limnocylindria bacterium]